MSAALRACVIGSLSSWYQHVHHPSLRRLGDRVRLAAASHLPDENPGPITRAFGFERAYADIDQMLEKERPDFVFLCVNPAAAPDLAVHVLERRIPLMMEKPVGPNPDEGRRVAAAAERAAVPNQVAFNRRWNPLLRRAKEFAERRGAVSQYVVEWLRHDVKSPRAMLGSALHGVDAFRFLAGEVRSFSSITSPARYFDNAVVAACLHIQTEAGPVASFTLNVRAGRAHERYRILGENWTATVNLPPPGIHDERWWLEVEDANRVVERRALADLAGPENCVQYAQGFWAQVENFVDCLATGRSPSPSIADAVRSMELAERFQRAVVPD